MPLVGLVAAGAIEAADDRVGGVLRQVVLGLDRIAECASQGDVLFGRRVEIPHEDNVVLEHRLVEFPTGGFVLQQEPEVCVQYLDAYSTREGSESECCLHCAGHVLPFAVGTGFRSALCCHQALEATPCSFSNPRIRSRTATRPDSESTSANTRS